MAGIIGGLQLPTSKLNGYWMSFAYSFVYDNGFESGISQFSSPVYNDQRKYIRIATIPTGPTIGGHVCVKRRIWQWVNFGGPVFLPNAVGQLSSFGNPAAGSTGAAMVFCDINDNSTGSITCAGDPALVSATSGNANVVNAQAFGQLVSLPNVAQPAGPTSPVSQIVMEPAVNYGFDPAYDVINGTALPNSTSAAVTIFSPSLLKYVRYSWVYANGVESNWSPSVSTDFLTVGVAYDRFGNPIPQQMPLIKGLQSGPTINGVPVIGVIVYASFFGDVWEPGKYLGVVLIPGTPAVTGYQPQFYNTCGRATKLANAGALSDTTIIGGGALPVWPNPDGPSLETNPPTELTDDNPDLLKEEGGTWFNTTTDLTQVRNRIHVQGAGSTLSAPANAGDTVLNLSDVTVFPTGATGQVYVDGMVISFSALALTALTNAGTMTLVAPLTRAISSGATVCNYLKVDDPKSQAALGVIEFDSNGNNTDGVHEYTIQDGSLTDYYSMFMAANAQLEVFSQPIVTIKYATRDPNSKVGQFVTVNLTNPPCVGTFLIQSVTTDQVHDESDQVGPRYTVTASSAKYTLDDLLLQIVPRASNGGGGSGGGSSVQSASTATAVGSTPTLTSQMDNALGSAQGSIAYRGASAWTALPPGGAGQVLASEGPNANPQWITPAGNTTPSVNDLFRQKKAYWYITTSPGNGTLATGVGIPTGSVGGSVTANAQTDALYALLTGSSVINSYTGQNAPNATGGVQTDDQDFIFDCQIMTGTIITNVRFLIGIGVLTNAAPANAAVQSGLTNRFFILRYDDSVPDPGWVGYLWDGANSFVTGNLGNIAASTRYALRIRKVGTSVFFSVNGGTESPLTAAASSGKGLNPFFGMYNTTAAARTFSFSHLVVSYGGPFF